MSYFPKKKPFNPATDCISGQLTLDGKKYRGWHKFQLLKKDGILYRKCMLCGYKIFEEAKRGNAKTYLAVQEDTS